MLIGGVMYTLAEDRLDELALTTEYFIDTPIGRLSVRMPNFITRKEQEKIVAKIVKSLNKEEPCKAK
jgi:hypothetical protein